MVAEPGCWYGLRDFLYLARAGDRTQIPSKSVGVDTSGKSGRLQACWFPSFLLGLLFRGSGGATCKALIRKFDKVGW